VLACDDSRIQIRESYHSENLTDDETIDSILCDKKANLDPRIFNPLDPEGNYSATSNRTKLVH